MAVTSEVCVIKCDGGIFLILDSFAKESSVAFGTCQKFILMLCRPFDCLDKRKDFWGGGGEGG